MELTTKDVAVQVCADNNQGSYTFRCPLCALVVSKQAEQRIIDLLVSSGVRMNLWNLPAELQEYVRRGTMPALQIVRLPNDHTAGARFAGVVVPGETIRVRTWDEGERVLVSATIAADGDRDGAPVLSDCVVTRA